MRNTLGLHRASILIQVPQLIWVVLLTLCLSIFVSSCSDSVTKESKLGTISLSPATATRYTFLSTRVEHEVKLSLPSNSISKAKLDVVLLFDRTGSMGAVIQNVAKVSQSLVKSIQSLSPDSRFAVASLADYYPLYSKTPEDTPWELVQDFRTDSDSIAKAIASIKLGHGGDAPESYVRALWETSRMSWRTDATKLVVLFGDNVHHDPDPGIDGILNTPDDLNMAATLASLKNKSIHVAGIYCEESSIGSLMGKWTGKIFGAGAEAERLYSGMWGDIARETDGISLRLDDPSKVLTLLHAAMVQAILPKHSIKESVMKDGATRTVALARADPIDLSEIANPKYRLHAAIKSDARAGAHILPMEALVTANSDLTTVPFTLRIVTGWYNFPLLLLLPLILFSITLCLWWLTLGGFGGRERAHHIYGKGPKLRGSLDWFFNLLPHVIWVAFLLAVIGLSIYILDGPVLTDWYKIFT